jgi:hypothetical protein
MGVQVRSHGAVLDPGKLIPGVPDPGIEVDFICKIEFRGVRWMVICYVTFFFAANGAMMGVASLAGSDWAIAAVILFLIPQFSKLSANDQNK